MPAQRPVRLLDTLHFWLYDGFRSRALSPPRPSFRTTTSSERSPMTAKRRLKSISRFLCFALCAAAVSCGTDGETGSSDVLPEALSESLAAYAAINQEQALAPCLRDYEPFYAPTPPAACACPNGGTAALTTIPFGPTASLTTGFQLTNCGDDSGQFSFTGTSDGVIQPDPEKTESTYDFPAFGFCTDLTGNLTYPTDTSECSGTITATCGGQLVSCELAADCTSCL